MSSNRDQLRHQLRDYATTRLCPLDMYAAKLPEFLKMGKQKSQLEKDEKGMGNPIITLPLNLPDFAAEHKARRERKQL